MSEKELSIRQKIEKGRAEYAFECVNKVKDQNFARDYRSYIKKIPSMILSNGAGQTLAFIKSKQKNEAYGVIYKQINEYFKNKDIPKIPMPEGKNDILVDWIVSCDSKTEYRYITTELLALFNWLRRFVEGMIKGE